MLDSAEPKPGIRHPCNMPTVLTHAVVGASLSTLSPSSVPRARCAAALAIASMFPDADVLAFSFGIPYEHHLGHRGLSHSLSFALAVAVAIGLTEFHRAAIPRLHRLWLTSLFFVAVASHGLLDSLTNGGLGVGLLLPFREGRFFAPWRPLEVSPIGVRGFLSGEAFAVLGSEALVVCLPLGVLLLTVLIIRRLLAERSGT